MSRAINPTNAGNSVPLGVLRMSLSDGVERRTAGVDLIEGFGVSVHVRNNQNTKYLLLLPGPLPSNEQDGPEVSHLRPYTRVRLRVGGR